MTRTMLRPCTATMPAANPISLCFHDAGKASIAATRTSVASTPLQPASIDTAKPLPALCNTLPCASTCESKILTMPAEMAARLFVHGTTNHACAQGVSSRPKNPACSARNRMKKRIISRDFTRCRGGSAQLGASERRIQREIALDPSQDGLGESLLMQVALEFHFLLGVGNERGLDQDGRNVGRLEHGEASLFHDAPMQRIVRADPLEYRTADAQAVVDLRGLRQVEHGLREHRLPIVEIDAPDQVGFVFALREPACGGAAGTAVRQREYRCATRRWRGEGIGVQGNEQ